MSRGPARGRCRHLARSADVAGPQPSAGQVLHQLSTQTIGPSELLRATTPEGAAVLELLRGADPFAVTSQMHTTWH